MEFKSRSDGSMVPRDGKARGKWSARPEPLALVPLGTHYFGQVFDPQKIAQTLTLALPPTRDGETMAVAIKHDNEQHAYVYDPAVYAGTGLRNDTLKLPHERYEVTVVADAGEISSPPSRFLLDNTGKSPRDLRLESLN